MRTPINLVCLHHAGGSASVFHRWHQTMPAEFPVLPVTLPDRTSPDGATKHRDLRTLVAHLDEELDDRLQDPFVIFGHSMGALVAYWLVQRRMLRGARLPLAFLAAAYPAPHLTRPILGGHEVETVDDVTLAHRLSSLGGLPSELMARQRWLGPLLAAVRADLRVCASHSYIVAPPLPMPVHVFAGEHDPLVHLDQVRGWAEHSADTFGIDVLAGGHFLVQEHEAQLEPVLRRRLRELRAHVPHPSPT